MTGPFRPTHSSISPRLELRGFRKGGGAANVRANPDLESELAQPPVTEETFLREVDEELRRAQMLGAWRRYGRAALVVLGVALIALAAFLWWKDQQSRKSGEQGEQLMQAFGELDGGKAREADTRLQKLAASSQDGYRVAALLTQADGLLVKGDRKGAAALFNKIAGDTGLAQPYRDVALLRAVSAEYDALPPAQVIARLKPLAVEGKPWFPSAGEMSALAYLKLGQRQNAASILTAIAKDKEAPGSIRSRALQMASSLGADMGSAVTAAVPNSPQPAAPAAAASR